MDVLAGEGRRLLPAISRDERDTGLGEEQNLCGHLNLAKTTGAGGTWGPDCGGKVTPRLCMVSQLKPNSYDLDILERCYGHYCLNIIVKK